MENSEEYFRPLIWNKVPSEIRKTSGLVLLGLYSVSINSGVLTCGLTEFK